MNEGFTFVLGFCNEKIRKVKRHKYEIVKTINSFDFFCVLFDYVLHFLFSINFIIFNIYEKIS